jgi:nitrite reductase/ring-hydroxylating ferredoxin subunit
LFERELVAWRGRHGRAVLMNRYCPHSSASLALGKVIDGCLRCRFHHWRFDDSGNCVEIPGAARIPKTAHQSAYPVLERYGFVWVWYGSPEPMFRLPEFPALDVDRRAYLAYRFKHTTPTPARRVLENAFDYYHFMTVHGVNATTPLRLTMLSEPEAALENGPAIATEAWFGALLESGDLRLPRVVRALGIEGKPLSLLVDGWPGGQRLTFFLDGHVVAKELLGVSPIARNHTIFQGWSLVRRSGQRLKDVLSYLMYRAQHRMGTHEDLKIYRHAVDAPTRVAVKYDYCVLRFRRHYQTWVERVDCGNNDVR